MYQILKRRKVRIKGPSFLSYQSISWSQVMKFEKLPIFKNHLIPKDDNLKNQHSQYLSVYLSRVKLMRLTNERKKSA